MHNTERGSTLLLFPSAILIVTLLSAIAVDLSSVHQRQHELRHSVSVAIDDAANLTDRTGKVDIARARRFVSAKLRTAHSDIQIDSITVEPSAGGERISIAVRGSVDSFFGGITGINEFDLHVAAAGERVRT